MLHCCIATTVVLEPAICEDLDLHVAIFLKLSASIKFGEYFKRSFSKDKPREHSN